MPSWLKTSLSRPSFMPPFSKCARATPWRQAFGAVLELREKSCREVDLAFFDEIFRFGNRKLARQGCRFLEDPARREIKDFCGSELHGDFQSDAVGVRSVGASLAIEAHRRNDRNDSFVEEKAERLGVHALDLAGVLLIHAAEDACGVDDEGVDVGGAEIDGGEPLHDFIGEPDRRINADLQRGFIREADAVGIGDVDSARGGQSLDLMACAMHQDDFDAQRTEHGKIQKDVRKILRVHDLAIHRNHKDALPEEGHILQNFTQVGDVHE